MIKLTTCAAADNTNVRADTCLAEIAEAVGFTCSAEERRAIDEANAALTPIIRAIDAIEDIERWVSPVVRGVRILRDRAKRETGALNYLDHQYRVRFSALLNNEPIGAWLNDPGRRAMLDAIHYLGVGNTLDVFLQWLKAEVTVKQRKKWRGLRTLVDHFKKSREGAGPKADRCSEVERKIEQVISDGHKADAAAAAEIEKARGVAIRQVAEGGEAFWSVLREAGPERIFESIKQNDDEKFARTLCVLLSEWLKDR